MARFALPTDLRLILARQCDRRDLLRRVMEKNNFTVYEFEWWHFDYADCTSWPIGNEAFEKLGK